MLEAGKTIECEAVPPWAWPNLLSLDAPLVALVWQSLMASSVGARLPWHHVWILGSAVWLVYVADRLLDARRLDVTRSHTLRHAFHYRYGRPLLMVWGCTFATTVVVAVRFLERVEWIHGGIVSLLVLTYVAYVHLGGRSRPRWAKELLTGVVFALGISLPCWADRAGAELLAIGLLCGALCSWNCLLIASWERDSDQAQRFASLPRVVPGISKWFSLVSLLLVLVAWGAVGCGLLTAEVAAIVTMSSLALAWLDRKAATLPPSMRGILADTALLTPLLAWQPW